MKNANTGRLGFTLIELLIVVLIIGILAAVALPQYQKAVDKTRYLQAVSVAEAAAKADRVYFLENGQYVRSFYDLDVQLPTPQRTDETGGWFYYPWGYCYFGDSDASSVNCQVYIEDGRAYYSIDLKQETRSCFATKDTARANQVCRTVTGKQGKTSGNYTSYSF